MSEPRRSPYPSELKRTESLMQREAYERAGAQARSLGVLAEHWWRGWDQWKPPPSRQLMASHRTP